MKIPILKLKDDVSGRWIDVPAIRGERGDKGEKGDTGQQGIQGKKGDQGIQGIRGEPGPEGKQGPAGTTTYEGLSTKPTIDGKTIDLSNTHDDLDLATIRDVFYPTHVIQVSDDIAITLENHRMNVIDGTAITKFSVEPPLFSESKPVDTILLLTTGASVPTIAWKDIDRYVIKGEDPFKIDASSAYMFMLVQIQDRIFITKHTLEKQDAKPVPQEIPVDDPASGLPTEGQNA